MEAYLTPDTHRSEKKRVQWNKGGEDDVVRRRRLHPHDAARGVDRGHAQPVPVCPRAPASRATTTSRAPTASCCTSTPRASSRTTGCPSGEIQTWLRIGNYDKARASAAEFQDIFGKENFFLELMDHGLEIETRVRDGLLRLTQGPRPAGHRHQRLPLRRTQRPRGPRRAAVRRPGTTLSDPKRMKFDGDGYYIKSAEEMRSLWEDKHDLKEACDNTLLIAERCQVEFAESNGGYMARADVPAGHTEESWFVEEVWRGIEHRYGDTPPDEVKARTEMELQVIRDKGYCGYYLVVADFINWAKDHGIRVGPGRGSGAGSIAAYALRITDLCPLQHGLIFERFLNPERPSMPDFDIDFDERRRGEVIQYVSDKYGSDRVAHDRHVRPAQVQGGHQGRQPGARLPVLAWASASPRRCRPTSWARASRSRSSSTPTHKRYSDGRDFRELHESDAEVRKIYDTAVGLEGQIRQWGVHAAGVIMSSEPLIDIVPIMKREQDGAIITQFDYPMCEALGLVKMDFLGLRNLTVLDDARRQHQGATAASTSCSRIFRSTTPTPTPCSAAATPSASSSSTAGRCASCCAPCSPTTSRTSPPSSRCTGPGPMGADSHTNYAKRKNGKQEITPIHPELAEPLEKILGDHVRPDRLPGAGHADRAGARRVLARTGRQPAAGHGQEEGRDPAEGVRAVLRGHGRARPLAQGHQGALGRPACRSPTTPSTRRTPRPTACCRTGRPTSRPTTRPSSWRPCSPASRATRTSRPSTSTSAGGSASRCCRPTSTSRRPTSRRSATTSGSACRPSATSATTWWPASSAGREEGGPYTDFTDFLDKVPAHVCNKRVLDSLIKAGAFDSLGHQRRALTTIAEDAVDVYIDLKRNAAIGQDSLFGGMRRRRHRRLDHRADRCRSGRRPSCWRSSATCSASTSPTTRCSGLEHVLARQQRLHDRPAAHRHRTARRQHGAHLRPHHRRAAQLSQARATPGPSVTVEDLEGALDVLVFPGAYQLAAPALVPDTIVVIKGRVAPHRRRPRLNALEVTMPAMSTGAAERRSSSACRSRAARPTRRHGSSRCSRPTPASPRSTCA